MPLCDRVGPDGLNNLPNHQWGQDRRTEVLEDGKVVELGAAGVLACDAGGVCVVQKEVDESWGHENAELIA